MTADIRVRPTRPAKQGEHVRAPWVAVSILLFVAVWWVASLLADVASPGLVPSPAAVATTFVELCLQPFAGLILPGHVLSSLSRWGLGVATGVVLGILLGSLLGWSQTVRAAVTPVFEFLRYIPPFAWIPLAILWMGVGQTSAAFIVFVAAFPAVVINTQVGIVNVDRRLPMAGINLGASELRTLTDVVFPVALPTVLSGIRIAATNGWMAVIAAEMISGTQGVGFLIIQGQENGDVPTIMAGMAAIGLTGAAVDGLLNVLGKRTTQWRVSSGPNS